MAVVHRARQSSTGRQFAIKCLRPELIGDGALRAEFLNEARTLGRLHHPNIIRLHDYGLIDEATAAWSGGTIGAGTPYLVMDYAEAGTLKNHPRSGDWAFVSSYLFAILDALAAAHAFGLVHRDLKPTNILVGQDGPILADFGIVYDIGADDVKQADGVYGTPNYMAPEQFQGRWRSYGPPTDLYALGCLTYWLCCGRPPFKGGDLFTISRQHLSEPPPDLKSLFAMPPGLTSWVHKCLRKEPELRFQLAADARYILDTLDISAATSDRLRDQLQYETDQRPSSMPSRTVNSNHWQNVATVHTASSLRPPLPDSWRTPADVVPGPLAGAGNDGLLRVGWPPFLKRDAERDMLWGQLREVTKGSMRVIRVVGESGVGKSALGLWLSRRAHYFGGALTLRVTHEGPSTDTGGLGGMLRRAWRAFGLHGEELHAHVERQLGDAAVDDLIPLLLCLESSDEVDSESAQQGVRFAALARWLTARCRQRPHILLIDDPTYGDESLAFVGYLKSQRPDLPLLVVMTSKATIPLHTLAGQLSYAEEDLADDEITLEPFTAQEHADLASSQLALSAELLGPLYTITGGNPLRLLTTLRAWASRDWFQPSVEGMVLKYDAVLGEETSQLELWEDVLAPACRATSGVLLALECAAALGTSFSQNEWFEVLDACQIPYRDDLVDVLINHSVLGLSDEQRLQFLHQQCAAVFRERMRRGQRLASVHGAVVQALEKQSYSSPVRLVAHMVAAGMYSRALARLPQAWRATRDSEQFMAARQLLLQWARCLRSTGVTRDGVEWLDLKLKWADICFELGAIKDAFRHAGTVARLNDRAIAPRLSIDALLIQTLAKKWVEGESQNNLKRIEQARQFANDTGDVWLICTCEERYAVYLHTYGHLERARAVFEGAQSWHELLEDDHLRMMISLGFARLFIDLGDLEQAEIYAQQARDVAPVSTGSSLFASLRLTLGDIYRRTARVEDAFLEYSQATATLRRLGAMELWAALTSLGLAYLELGRPRESLSAYHDALEEAARLESTTARTTILSCSLRTLAHLGRWRDLDDYLATLGDLKEHNYAQIDSLDSLRSLLGELDGSEHRDRRPHVMRLFHDQRTALGVVE